MNKFRNIRTLVDGIKFDSKGEANRYIELKLLQSAGQIKDLKLQVPFILYDKNQYGSKVKYIADFTYFDHDNKYVVEDFKGVRTPAYRLKKRLMAEIHGIRIFESGGRK